MENDSLIIEQVANADLYLNNAFRILEVPVNVDEKEIRRRQKIIDFSISNNQTPPGGPFSLFAHPVNTKEALTSAIYKIHDPNKRFLDEFFWFWPSESEEENNQILSLISENRMDALLDLWQADDNFINIHNLAVYSHMSALDLERKLVDSGLSEIQKKRLQVNWMNAYKRWDGILGSSNLWDWCYKRVDEYSDARLTENDVQSLMDRTLPSLVAINANLALDFLNREKFEIEAERHFEIINSSSLPEEKKHIVFSKIVSPVCDRISLFISNTELSCEKDPIHSDKFIRDLVDNSMPLLSITDRFHGNAQDDRQIIHDKVVMAARKLLVPYVKKTDDWQTARDLTNRIKNIAIGDETRELLKDDLTGIENLSKQGNWCRKGYYDLPPELLSELERLRGLFSIPDFAATIDGLRTLLAKKGPEEFADFIKTPLATVLVDKADMSLAEKLRAFDDPRPFLTSIKNAMNGVLASRVSSTILAINTGNEQKAARYGNLYCMACCAPVSSWYILEIDHIKYLLCESCHQRDVAEMETRKSGLRNTLTSEYRNLIEAQTLDPSNPEIEPIRKVFEECAGHINVKLPRWNVPSWPGAVDPVPKPVAAPKPASSTAIFAPVQSEYQPATAAETEQPSPQTKNGISFWHRFITCAIDMGLAYLLIVGGLWFTKTNFIDFPESASVIFFWFYYALCHGLFTRTPGELLCGTRLVMNSNGTTPGILAALWRATVLSVAYYFLNAFWLSFTVLLLFPVVNDSRRGLEDLLSGTKHITN